ncbi:MAG: PaaI family thioesterase [Thermodesulfobacteriota bacterium]|jgi:acyl-CoA thioesterase
MTEKIPKTPKPAKRFLELIGLKFIKMEKGFSRSELTITASLLNPYDSLHGGVVYSMADTGMGGALSSCLEEDERCSTIEIKINYLKSVHSGRLTCDTKVIHQGKNIAFLESVVKDHKGKPVATATGTFNIFKISS